MGKKKSTRRTTKDLSAKRAGAVKGGATPQLRSSINK
jgi:hypothetical protein